jgi:hypothetical protein
MGKYIVGIVGVLMGLAIVFIKAPAISGRSGVDQASGLIAGTASGLAGDINAIEGGSTVSANSN